MKTTTGLPEGPTNNPEFNYLLQKWAREGHETSPTCEDCETDLTGKDVVECHGWLCTNCAENDDADPVDWRQHERKQMGIGG